MGGGGQRRDKRFQNGQEVSGGCRWRGGRKYQEGGGSLEYQVEVRWSGNIRNDRRHQVEVGGHEVQKGSIRIGSCPKHH